MLAFAKIFSILVTVAGGLLAVFGKTTAATPEGRTKLTSIGRFSILVVLLGGLATYISDHADKEAAATAARIDKEWDSLRSSPITGIIIQPGTRSGYLKLVDLADFATKTSLDVVDNGSRERRSVRVTSDSSPDKPDIRFSLSVTGDGIKEPLHSEAGKIWTEYPGSTEWLCYWAMKRPQVSRDTWACSLEFSLDNPEILKIRTLDDLNGIAYMIFSAPADFEYEARLFGTQSSMHAGYAIQIGEYAYDITPRDDDFIEHLDETKTPPVRRLEAEVTGSEVLWRLRSRFFAYGGKPSATEPRPLWWRVRFQVADWLDDVLPTWISGHLPDLYPEPPKVVERQAAGQIVNLYGYYPRPPNAQERAVFAKWMADHSPAESAK